MRAKVLLAVAARNIARQKRRSLLLGGAVAFSSLVMGLTSGMTAGMERAVQDNVALAAGGHLVVSGLSRGSSGRPQARIQDAAGLAARVAGALPDALSVSPIASTQAGLVFGTRQQSLRLSGVDWASDKLYRGSLVLVAGDWDSATAGRAAILPSGAAERFGASVGDVLIARMATASGQQNATEYVVGAVYDDAAAGGMLTVLAGFGDLASDLGLAEGQSQALAVFLPDARGAEKAAAALVAALGASRGTAVAPTPAAAVDPGDGGLPAFGYAGQSAGGQGREQEIPGGQGAGALGAATPRAALPRGAANPWGDAPSPAGAAAAGERRPQGQARAPREAALWVATIGDLSGQVGEMLGIVSWIGYAVFGVMLALAAAGISNTFRMILLERTKEIGTLRCIGFRRRQIFLLVVAEAEGVALLGAAAGLLASLPLGASAGLLRFGADSAASIVLAAGRPAFYPDIVSLSIVIAGVALMAFAAAAGPARSAASLPPAEAMRAITA